MTHPMRRWCVEGQPDCKQVVVWAHGWDAIKVEAGALEGQDASRPVAPSLPTSRLSLFKSGCQCSHLPPCQTLAAVPAKQPPSACPVQEFKLSPSRSIHTMQGAGGYAAEGGEQMLERLQRSHAALKQVGSG